VKQGAVPVRSLAKVLLSIAVLGLLLAQIDPAATVQRLAQLRLAVLPTVLAFIVGQFVLSGWRWEYILRRLRATDPGLGALLHAMGKGYFYGKVLPSSVGMDVLRTAIVDRSVGLRPETLSVVLDRLYGLVVLAAWAAAALPLVGGRLGVEWRSVLLIEAMLAVGGVASIAALRAGFRGSGPIRRLFDRVGGGVPAEAASVVLNPAVAGILVLTTGLMHLATFGQFYAVAWALGLPLGFASCLLLLPAAFLLSALPISFSGWGVREGAVVAALAVVGIGAGDAVTASILFGLIAPALGEWLAPFARKHFFRSAE
jgi:uncharacterized membrane protein YbhN (UPF0104 family)